LEDLDDEDDEDEYGREDGAADVTYGYESIPDVNFMMEAASPIADRLAPHRNRFMPQDHSRNEWIDSNCKSEYRGGKFGGLQFKSS
jgi:hypothetical protein